MNVNIKVDSTRLEAYLKDRLATFPAEVDKAVLSTATRGIAIITDRTAKGEGFKGSFKPYTDAYAKFKEQRFGGDRTVNLFATGKMLGSMIATKKSRGVAEIGFSRATESKKAAFNNRKRPFFGFNNSEVKKLSKHFQKELFK